jgi:hypothetical protein
MKKHFSFSGEVKDIRNFPLFLLLHKLHKPVLAQYSPLALSLANPSTHPSAHS